jgi:DeoR/GlpR family transcriptional regulator of sugar metabolism
MNTATRLEQIAEIVDERGFVSVAELSRVFAVSEMTIRRDLGELDRQKRVQRTFGGAASLRSSATVDSVANDPELSMRRATSLVQRVDVLIATALNPKVDGVLLETISSRKSMPIIAESLSIQKEVTVVAVDNYQAGLALGRWAGEYCCQHFNGVANLLDLTYYLSNTQLRSHGFIDGLHQVAPQAHVILSLDAQSRLETAYQLTRDALTVHQQINLIFALNDITAWGAIRACRELEIDPQNLALFTFGLEGDTLKNALAAGEFCRAGLAMFPEVVGPVCIEAAILANNRQELPAELVTPHAVLSASNLGEYYTRTTSGWEICWEKLRADHDIPLDIFRASSDRPPNLPHRIGLVVPFVEHEWYQNLAKSMRVHTDRYGIDFEIIDVHQSIKDEVDMRRREIARLAAKEVEPGDVILLDAGTIMNYLAEVLLAKDDITVITNAISVFEILRANPEIVIILTGGVHRQSSKTLVGPTAENALRELRADKCFLTAAGVSLSFGLSHTHVAEVTMKQAMLRSARQIILLADHTNFEQESIVQIAPLTVVNIIITDDVLPASLRLELTKLGIEIKLAST